MKILLGFAAALALLFGLQGCGDKQIDPATFVANEKNCKQDLKKERFKSEWDWGVVNESCDNLLIENFANEESCKGLKEEAAREKTRSQFKFKYNFDKLASKCDTLFIKNFANKENCERLADKEEKEKIYANLLGMVGGSSLNLACDKFTKKHRKGWLPF